MDGNRSTNHITTEQFFPMKISIIIPTRERPRYLPYALRTALAIEDDDVEIIVNDNASQDNTAEIVAGIDDPRLRYFNTGARVSMRENFNHALANSHGDYVIFFGDDDAILPGQFPYLRRMLEEHQPDGLTWNRATYGWPDEGYGRKTGGGRFYRETSFSAPVIYDPAINQSALMKCQLLGMQPTPNIYHGCAARAYLDRIAPAKDMWFDSAIPDVNFEHRTILTGGKFVFANHVFTINGYSPASTGGAHHDKSGDARSVKAGEKFIAEVKSDPLKDVLEHALCVPLAFFSTLETVRTRMGVGPEFQPDYTEWYRFVLASVSSDPTLAPRLNEILDAHAEKTNTQPALSAARTSSPRSKRTAKERLARILSQASSFRRSANIDGENTVLSAAQLCDAVYGSDYDAVLNGDLGAHKAWRATKHRAKKFTKEL